MHQSADKKKNKADNQKSTSTELFAMTLAELSGFIEAVEERNKEEEQEPKKGFFQSFGKKDPVPRGESQGSGPDGSTTKKNKDADKDQKDKKDEASPGSSNKKADAQDKQPKESTKERNDAAHDKNFDSQNETSYDTKESPAGFQYMQKSDFGTNQVTTDVKPRPRYVEYDETMPTITAECAKEAVRCMRELRDMQNSHRSYLLVCIRDDGKRSIELFYTKEAAINRMKQDIELYINEIEPKDTTAVIYEDDGANEHIFEPTPKEHIAKDGTIKRPSEIDDTMHRFEQDDRGIVYFETQNATARWDIYDLDDARIGDPDDPAMDKFIKDRVKKENNNEH